MEDKKLKYFNQDILQTDPYYSRYLNNNIDIPSKILKTESNVNLNEKLNDAYTDLEKLKRAVDEIKTSKGNMQINLDRDKASTRLMSESEDIFKKSNLQNFNSKEMRLRQIQTESANDYRPQREDNIGNNYQNFKTPNRHDNISSSKSNFLTPMVPKSSTKQKADDIITNFKEILKESERHINDQPALLNYPSANHYQETKYSHSVNNLKSMNNDYNSILEFNSPNIKFSNNRNFNQTAQQENENNFNNFVNKITSNNMKEEIDRIRISNQVLNKSNLDLKNQNKILQYEIEVLQNSNTNNLGSHSNFDHNMNNFIEGLKNSLNSCQMSNKELGDIIENLQKKNSDLTNENNLLREQSVIMKSEIETIKKKFCELKLINENLQNDKSRIENDHNQLLLKLNEKEEKGNEDEEKISNLFLLIENYEKNKNDNLDVLENLKNTMEVLKKTNSEIEKEKSNLNNKIEEMQNEILQKNYEIDQLKNSVQSEFKDKDYIEKENKNLKEDITAKEIYLKEIQIKLRNTLMEVEKNKTKMETVNLNIEEKDHVITNLKNSLNYYTKTFEETENELENLKLKIDSEVNEKIKIIQNFEICRKKLNDLQNSTNEIKTSKEELQMKNLKLEKELIEKRNKIGQMEFENEILSEKLLEKDSLINKYKEETKLNKLNKITEDINSNYIRGNDNRKKNNNTQNDVIEEMSSQMKLKDQMINELLEQIEEMATKKENNNSIRLNKHDEAEDENPICILDQQYPQKDSEKHKFNLPLNSLSNNNNSGSDLYLPMHSINTPRLNELGIISLTKRAAPKENLTHIYSVYDGKTIASFDLIKNKFEIFELVNSNKFEEDFNSDSVLTLNTPEGFFVVTGINSNQIFYFDYEERSMKLYAQLAYNHKSGGLVYYSKNNGLYCLSGNHIKSCEKLSLSDDHLETFSEMLNDRAHSSYVIMNENYLYAFFGYSYLNATYLDSIERINLDASESNWELIDYSYYKNAIFSTCLKSFVCLQKNEEEILIIGGYDGKNRTNNKNIIKFNSKSSSVQSHPEIKTLLKLCLYDCNKENKTVSYVNGENEAFSAIFDDYFQLHLINSSTLEHQIFDNSDKNI
jgi:hypothetical protein